MSTQMPLVKMDPDYMPMDSPGSVVSVSSEGNSPYHPTSYYPSPYITPPPTATPNHSAHPLDGIAVDIAQHSPYDSQSQYPDGNQPTYVDHSQTASPYNPAENHSPNYPSMLQVPPMDPAPLSPTGSMQNSPQYSPEASSSYVEPAQQMQLMPDPTPMHSELLAMKPFPNRSPLEGGGTLALVFSGALPPGNKWVSFTSTQRNEYTVVSEAYEENPMALTTIIPKHHVPETVVLQVMCNSRVVAQSEFTYFASAQYNSDMLFQYLSQNLPSYFHHSDLGGGAMGGGLGGGDGGGGYMYSGGIPSSTFGLLLGGCRLGIEPLVYATLHLPSMQRISMGQVQKARDIAEEFGHDSIVECLTLVLKSCCSLVSRGGGDEEEEGEEGEKPAFNEENKNILEKLDKGADPEAGGAIVLNRLVQIAKMEKRAKQEEEREQQVPSTPEAESSLSDAEKNDTFTDGPRPRRTSSTNKLKRQEESISEEEYDAITPTSTSSSSSADGHGRRSLEEQADSVAPLIGRGKFSQSSSTTRRMLVATHSDADSAVSMSFDRDECESEILRRSSCSIASSGLFSLNMSTTEGAVDVNIDRDAGETFVNSVQYECTYIITEDYPPGDKEVVFKAGDRIVQVGNTYVRDKGPEDFAELLHREATRGTTIKIVPRVERTPPPSGSFSTTSSIQGSLEGGERRLVRRQSEQQLLDSITMKVSNLLTMKASGTKRTVTIPRTEGGYGFKMIGGNAVGLFISEVRPSLKDVTPGDQILQVNGQDTSHMTHFEATDLLRSSERVTLVVTENNARFKTIREQFEFDSFFIRSCLDHTSTDPRDMKLHHGTLMRVVNTILYGGNFWLAWTVDESTGLDSELRRIPSPAKIKKIHGKDAYERVAAPRLKEDTSARVLVA